MAIYSGFTHYNLWFSIVTLVYQRVDHPKNSQHIQTWSQMQWFLTSPPPKKKLFQSKIKTGKIYSPTPSPSPSPHPSYAQRGQRDPRQHVPEIRRHRVQHQPRPRAAGHATGGIQGGSLHGVHQEMAIGATKTGM